MMVVILRIITNIVIKDGFFLPDYFGTVANPNRFNRNGIKYLVNIKAEKPNSTNSAERLISIIGVEAYNLEEIDFSACQDGFHQDHRGWTEGWNNRNNGRLIVSQMFRKKHTRATALLSQVCFTTFFPAPQPTPAQPILWPSPIAEGRHSRSGPAACSLGLRR